MLKVFAELGRDESGSAIVEYGLVTSLISLSVVSVLFLVGLNLDMSHFSSVLDVVYNGKPVAP